MDLPATPHRKAQAYYQPLYPSAVVHQPPQLGSSGTPGHRRGSVRIPQARYAPYAGRPSVRGGDRQAVASAVPPSPSHPAPVQVHIVHVLHHPPSLPAPQYTHDHHPGGYRYERQHYADYQAPPAVHLGRENQYMYPQPVPQPQHVVPQLYQPMGPPLLLPPPPPPALPHAGVPVPTGQDHAAVMECMRPNTQPLPLPVVTQNQGSRIVWVPLVATPEALTAVGKVHLSQRQQQRQPEPATATGQALPPPQR